MAGVARKARPSAGVPWLWRKEMAGGYGQPAAAKHAIGAAALSLWLAGGYPLAGGSLLAAAASISPKALLAAGGVAACRWQKICGNR